MIESSKKLYKELIDKCSYLSKSDIQKINNAVEFAEKAHTNTFRYSEEPYLNHLLSTAIILTELRSDLATIIGGLLHDTLEDTEVTAEEIAKLFGPEVLALVNGVTKVSQIKLKNIELKTSQAEQIKQLESLRKLFLAMAKDLRVVLIKLSDRLHNMRTLEYVPTQKQERIAKETMEIYVPLANRLGLWYIKSNLEDTAFKFLEPEAYANLYKEIEDKTKKGKLYINKATKYIQKSLAKNNIVVDQVGGRTKNIYSIYLKTVQKHHTLDEIYDIYAIRIIAKNITDCYACLGVVHNIFKPIPGRFKDYIAVPKPNGYQSLHTSVFALDGQKLEIQIRTQEMHDNSENGIAAHWHYKEKGKSTKEFNWISNLAKLKDMNLQELNQELQIDLFTDRIFVYTPKGDVKDLPIGSTPIDFAYSIHSGVGDRLVGAKISGKIVPLDHQLQNGDIIEILTAKNALQPKRQWLDIAKTSQAKNRIKSFLKKINYDENVQTGKKIIENELKKLNLPELDQINPGKLSDLTEKLNYKNLNDVYSSLAHGELSIRKIISNLFPPSELFKSHNKIKSIPATEKKGTIIFGSGDSLSYSISKTCCQPAFPMQIIGYITRGKGINIHTLKCPNLKGKDPSRLIPAHWQEIKPYLYTDELLISCYDKVGLLHEITKTIVHLNLNLSDIQLVQKEPDCVKIRIAVQINTFEELSTLINQLQKQPDIINIQRL